MKNKMSEKETDAVIAHAHGAYLNKPRTLGGVLKNQYDHATAKRIASEKTRWHRHKNGGGWVRDDAEVAEAAFVSPRSAIHGPHTSVGPDVYVEGESVVGAGVRVTGKTLIEFASVSGEKPGHWGSGIVGRPVPVFNTILSYSHAIGSKLRESQVRNQVRIENSLVDQSRVEGRDSSIIDSDVRESKIDNSVVAESNINSGSTIDDALVVNTYVTPGTKIKQVEMYDGHVKRSRKYAALEKAGAISANRLQRSRETPIAQGGRQHVR